LRALARQIPVRGGALDLIGVDYVQLMRAEHPTGNRAAEVSGFSRRLKELARELDGPVIAVSEHDRASSSVPGVVTTRMDGRLGSPPIAAIVSVDARLSTGLERCRSGPPFPVSTTPRITGLTGEHRRISNIRERGHGRGDSLLCRGPREM
jgi:replicative DNA helicase